MYRAALILSLGVLAHVPAGAQPAAEEDLSAGQRVRVTLASTHERIVAKIVETGDARLTLQPVASSETRQLQWADVSELQVSRGKHRNTLKGVLGGAAAWALTLGLMAAFDTLDESGLGEPLVIGGYLATGALVGTFVKTERWGEVPVPSAGRAVSRSGPGLRLQVAVKF
jgi:hypothetical protein